jgi:hypothetical protein
VAENRALAQEKLGAPLIVDGYAQQITRQQITRELHAVHLRSDGSGERTRQRGLPDAGDVLDQDVPASEKCDDGELDDCRLTFERAFDGAP